MYFSKKYKFVFMHINKTGGRSLTKFLLETIPDFKLTGLGHKAVHKSYHWLINSNLIPKDYQIVTIIRNPWERYESLYRYRKMKYSMGMEENGTRNVDAALKSFDEWFWYQLGSYDYLDRPQVDWLPDDLNTLYNRMYYLTLENIEADVIGMFSAFDIVTDGRLHRYPHINKSPAEKVSWKPESFLALNVKEEYIINRFYRGVTL